jgi:hypothetical protein
MLRLIHPCSPPNTVHSPRPAAFDGRGARGPPNPRERCPEERKNEAGFARESEMVMEAIINVYDQATHVYDYYAGRVLPHEIARQPIWNVSVERPDPNFGGPYRVCWDLRAPSFSEALRLASQEFRRLNADPASVRIWKVHPDSTDFVYCFYGTNDHSAQIMCS